MLTVSVNNLYYLILITSYLKHQTLLCAVIGTKKTQFSYMGILSIL